MSPHAAPTATRIPQPTRRLLLPLLAAPLLLATALTPAPVLAEKVSGSGTLVTDKRALPAFRAIELNGSMDLVVRQGAQEVLVTADHNLLELLETVVEDRRGTPTLVLRWKRSLSLYTRNPLGVAVTVPTLAGLAVRGSGDVRVAAFETPALNVSLSGSGDVRLESLSATDLVVAVSGSGDVAGAGRSARLTVSIAGSGDVRLADLKAENVKVSIAGSGDAAVHADASLEVTIAGSGDVNYTGNPSLRSQVVGSGSVNRR